MSPMKASLGRAVRRIQRHKFGNLNIKLLTIARLETTNKQANKQNKQTNNPNDAIRRATTHEAARMLEQQHALERAHRRRYQRLSRARVVNMYKEIFIRQKRFVKIRFASLVINCDTRNANDDAPVLRQHRRTRIVCIVRRRRRS